MMKIGLVKHFRVHDHLLDQKLLYKQQVIEWFAGYHRSEDIGYKSVFLLTLTDLVKVTPVM